MEGNTTDVTDIQNTSIPGKFRDMHEFLPSFRIVNFIMVSLTLWLLINLIIYGKVANKWRLKKEEGKLYIFSLIAVILVLPRIIVDQLRFDDLFLGGRIAECEFMSDVSDVSYGLALYASYFSLWMRQRMIYASPCLKALHGVVMTACSWGVCFVITGGTIAAVSIYAIPPAVKRAEYGCVEIHRDNYANNWDQLRNYIVGGGLMAAQLMLLALFIVPMVKIQMFSGSRNHAKDSISRVVRRSFLFTCVAIFSDITVALIVTEVMPDGYYVLVGDVIYNMAAFTNVCCVISMLGLNKKIATVFCRGSPRKRVRRSSTLRSGCYSSSITKPTFSNDQL